jgi:hypothetical protein
MRKLWLDVEPGKDIRQDLIFNYPQVYIINLFLI